MTSFISHTTIDCRNAYELSEWWKRALEYVDQPDDPNEPTHEECWIQRPDGGHPLLFIEVPEGKSVKNRIHLDLRPSAGTRDEELARLLELGARQVDDQRMYGRHRLGGSGRPGGQRVLHPAQPGRDGRQPRWLRLRPRRPAHCRSYAHVDSRTRSTTPCPVWLGVVVRARTPRHHTVPTASRSRPCPSPPWPTWSCASLLSRRRWQMPRAGCSPSTSPVRRRCARSWSRAWSTPGGRCSSSPRPCVRPRTSPRSCRTCSIPPWWRSTRPGRRFRTNA